MFGLKRKDSAIVLVIDRDEVTIGRHTSNNIVIPAILASRFHCCILKIDGRFYIKDKHSVNGTYIKSNLLISDRETLLKPGDVIGIGCRADENFSCTLELVLIQYSLQEYRGSLQSFPESRNIKEADTDSVANLSGIMCSTKTVKPPPKNGFVQTSSSRPAILLSKKHREEICSTKNDPNIPVRKRRRLCSIDLLQSSDEDIKDITRGGHYPTVVPNSVEESFSHPHQLYTTAQFDPSHQAVLEGCSEMKNVVAADVLFNSPLGEFHRNETDPRNANPGDIGSANFQLKSDFSDKENSTGTIHSKITCRDLVDGLHSNFLKEAQWKRQICKQSKAAFENSIKNRAKRDCYVVLPFLTNGAECKLKEKPAEMLKSHECSSHITCSSNSPEKGHLFEKSVKMVERKTDSVGLRDQLRIICSLDVKLLVELQNKKLTQITKSIRKDLQRKNVAVEKSPHENCKNFLIQRSMYSGTNLSLVDTRNTWPNPLSCISENKTTFEVNKAAILFKVFKWKRKKILNSVVSSSDALVADLTPPLHSSIMTSRSNSIQSNAIVENTSIMTKETILGTTLQTRHLFNEIYSQKNIIADFGSVMTGFSGRINFDERRVVIIRKYRKKIKKKLRCNLGIINL